MAIIGKECSIKGFCKNIEHFGDFVRSQSPNMVDVLEASFKESKVFNKTYRKRSPTDQVFRTTYSTLSEGQFEHGRLQCIFQASGSLIFLGEVFATIVFALFVAFFFVFCVASYQLCYWLTN